VRPPQRGSDLARVKPRFRTTRTKQFQAPRIFVRNAGSKRTTRTKILLAALSARRGQ